MTSNVFLFRGGEYFPVTLCNYSASLFLNENPASCSCGTFRFLSVHSNIVERQWFVLFCIIRNHVSSLPKQWPFHRSASLSNIPDQPHINYLSLSVNNTLIEVFSEADFKYLTDDQWQELQQINSHSCHRAVTFENDIS